MPILNIDPFMKFRMESESDRQLWNHGLNKRLNLSLECFSIGEIKRLGLIRAWIKNKEIEVLDEPTSNLDDFNADIVKKIIKERSQKKMILISSHDEGFMIEGNKIMKLDNYK